MFDFKIKFETTIKVKKFDKDFEKLLNSCNTGKVNVPYALHTIDHTMTITDSPIIPDETWIENSKNIIFEQMTKSFEQDETMNVEVIETKFVGFTEVKQK